MKDAFQKLAIADHLLSTTYTMVQEPKLLVSVIENILRAMEAAVTASLDAHLISYSKTLESKMDMFRRKIIAQKGLDPAIVDFVMELRDIVQEHKKSIVEFKKKEKYVIADNDYHMRSLTAEDARKKLRTAKKYIDEMRGHA
jgi:hypothetical protein